MKPVTKQVRATSFKPILLIILDGWGYRKQRRHNAILQSSTPVFDQLMSAYPSTVLDASGPAVGLPQGVFGNSEVGHLTLGAGRIVDSHQVRIDKSIIDGTFYRNNHLNCALNHAKKNHSTLHLVGLLSDKGVHADCHHLFAIMNLCKQKKFSRVVVHPILDGRDTPQKSCLRYLEQLFHHMNHLKLGSIGSLVGRYYAMDRDNRWDRISLAYAAMTKPSEHTPLGEDMASMTCLIRSYYSKGITDEFIPPLSFGLPISDNDAVIFTNFREDRARQLTHTFVDQSFSKFKRNKIRNLFFTSFTRYDRSLTNPVAFPLIPLKNTLGEIYSRQHIKQLRIAETEKYAHVTYFFNALRQRPFSYEDRILIPSPKVATYDKTPRMSAWKITKTALRALKDLKANKYGLIVVNFANADMVGHTGNFLAIKKAVSYVDSCVGKLTEEMLNQRGIVVITADHGNAETKIEQFKTSHTFAPVPFIICDHFTKQFRLKTGSLSCVSPTLLRLAGIKIPKQMSKPLFA